MDYSTRAFPVFHHLPEFAQNHVYCVDDAIQPSHPLLSPFPPALNLSQHQGLFQCQWLLSDRSSPWAQASGAGGFPGGVVVKNPPANAGDARDVGLIPGSGRSPGGGNGNLLQYSCLQNSIDRGA